MGTLRGVGEYAGYGMGEADTSNTFIEAVNEDSQPDHGENGSVSAADFKPLLVLYDCEATGLSIYSDHLTHLFRQSNEHRC